MSRSVPYFRPLWEKDKVMDNLLKGAVFTGTARKFASVVSV
jgi:hypothetical protein